MENNFPHFKKFTLMDETQESTASDGATADSVLKTITCNGSRELTEERIKQAMEEFAALKQLEVLEVFRKRVLILLLFPYS